MELKMRDKLIDEKNAPRSEMAWNPERLRWLVEKSGVPTKDIAGATDLKAETLRHYVSGYAAPSLYATVKLADYFQVPVDFLVGRCSERETNDIFDHFSDYFEKLQNASYNAYLFDKYVGDSTLKEDYVSGWPFNLVESVFCREGEECVEFDREGLEEAIETLTPREIEIIDLRFKQEKTLREVAEQYQVSRESVRRAQDKALKKLRHPARTRMIKYGKQGVDWMNRISEREFAVAKKERELAERESMIEAAEKQSDLELGEDRTAVREMMRQNIREMNISTRAKNSLARYGCKTVKDVCDVAERGILLEIRNMGWLSSREVLTLLRDEYGKDYFRMYRAYTSQEQGEAK